MKSATSPKLGFTIVELVIIIIIIGTLAAITIIGYGNWQKQATHTQAKSDLNMAVATMRSACNFGDDGCPTSLPSSQTFSDGIEVNYIEGDSKDFCIEASSAKYFDVHYYFDTRNGSKLTQGTCLGGTLYDGKYTAFVYDLSLPNCTTSTIQLPMEQPSSGGTVVWGDGSQGSLTSSWQSHTYPASGKYTALYEGTVSQINTSGISSAANPCLWKVSQWSEGASPWQVKFGNARNLTYVAEVPSSVWDMAYVFNNAKSFNQPIGDWDMSHVTKLAGAFAGASSFNQNINNWDVSNVTNLDQTFLDAAVFNQPLNNWNISNVTSLGLTFTGAVAFNQPLNNWNTSNVTSMHATFGREYCGCPGPSSFNQPLNNWNTSKVTDMSWMFNDASAFNQNINNWDVSNVTDLSQMFAGATNFNQPLNLWNTAKNTNLVQTFAHTAFFNQPVGMWNTANVTNMHQTFHTATAFNQPLNTWNTSKVTNMGRMFREAASFNQPLNTWDVSKVTSMNQMFQSDPPMNQNLTSWNPILVTDVTNATKSYNFNGGYPSWPTSSLPTFPL